MTYGIQLEGILEDYSKTFLATDAWKEWNTAAVSESEILEKYEFGRGLY